MDYKEYSGETISEQDKAFAQEFSNFVNGRMCSADLTGKELTRAHCYLQQQMFKVCIGFIRQLALNYQKDAMMSVTSGLPILQQRHTTD